MAIGGNQMESQVSFAVLGTGALGGLYGGLLANAGFDVHFLLRSDFEHVSVNGLKVETPLGDFHLEHPQVYSSMNSMPTVDVVLVCWKTTQTINSPQPLSTFAAQAQRARTAKRMGR